MIIKKILIIIIIYILFKKYINHIFIINKENFKDFDGITGDIGPKGFRGPKGLMGFPGPTGSIGEQGIKGTPGNIGDKGIPGDIGDIGKDGVRGDRGPKGLKGQIGNIGRRGNAGQSGPAGEKGEEGEKGMPGVKGNDGPIGKSGFPSSLLGVANQKNCSWRDIDGLNPSKIHCGDGQLIAGIKSTYVNTKNYILEDDSYWKTTYPCSESGPLGPSGRSNVTCGTIGCTAIAKCSGTAIKCECTRRKRDRITRFKYKKDFDGHGRNYQVKCCDLQVPVEPPNFVEYFTFKDFKNKEGVSNIIGQYSNLNTCKSNCLSNSSCLGITDRNPAVNGIKCTLHKSDRYQDADPGFYIKKSNKNGTGNVLGSYSKLIDCKKNCLKNNNCKGITNKVPPENGFKCTLHDSITTVNYPTSRGIYDFYEKETDTKIKELKDTYDGRFIFYKKLPDEQKMNNIIGKPLFDKQKNWTIDDEISRLPKPRI